MCLLEGIIFTNMSHFEGSEVNEIFFLVGTGQDQKFCKDLFSQWSYLKDQKLKLYAILYIHNNKSW